MGMSASQARLLSLQARMSDVEYEGQQINQQRLVLSNKMNEVMEKMTNMDVPTPPSKQDFLYNVYKGKTRNGKTINATMNDDGTFNITKEVSGCIVTDAGLQNITHGANITGTKLTESAYINGSSDKFRDAQDGETPTEYRSATPVSLSDFKAYDTNDYLCKYTSSNPLSFMPTDQPYTQNNAQGTSYGKDLKITVPKYRIDKSTTTTKGGFYLKDDTNKYLGITLTRVDDAPVKYQWKSEQLTEEQIIEENKKLKEEYKGTGEPSQIPIEQLPKCTAYQLYDSTTGKPLKELYYCNPGVNISTITEKKEATTSTAYILRQVGTEEISLTGLYTAEKYNQELNELQNQIDKIFNKEGFNQNNITVEGASSDINRNDVKFGYNLQKPTLSNNNKFQYNTFVGTADIPKGAGFDSKNTYINRGSGNEYSGADLVAHNKAVNERLNGTYYYFNGTTYEEISGKDAANKPAGTIFNRSDSKSGKGLVGRTLNAEVLLNCYYIDGKGAAHKITKDNIAAIAKGLLSHTYEVMRGDRDGLETFVNGDCTEDDITVNGRKTKRLTKSVLGEYADNPTFQDAITGLKHTFYDPNSGLSDAEFYEQYSVIINESDSTPTFSFCRYDELMGNATSGVDNQVRVFNSGYGEYDEMIPNVEVSYDSKGYLQETMLPNGEMVSMVIEQRVDEYKYDIAYNQYEIAKIEYDKEVNELNKQTSIYQRQDKQLELKLTRLDTERNALNTEIDAVKKVIQDATEKGFKTFSG